MLSLIIRAKNEERWIVPCLKGVLRQEVDDDIEIILVDNNSTDKTVEKALNYSADIKVININEFKPGYAINEGIRASSGDLLVCLSAHCIPAHHDWLQKLKDNFYDDTVAGVYGRQIPMESTNDLDKRDLLVTFGRDKRIQVKDPFFHNANSMFRRDVWERFEFDENATNIEDRIWGNAIINAGYKIVYEPEAQVYHHHGIHQSRNEERCTNIVRIMEEISTHNKDLGLWEPMPTNDLEITAFVPWRTAGDSIDSELARFSIERAVQSTHINKVVVLTDSSECKKIAEEMGAWVPFLRPKELSLPEARLNQVLKYSLLQLEERGYYPDIVVLLELIYPFRDKNLLDVLIERLLSEGVDSAIAGYEEFRPCWYKSKENPNFSRLDDFMIPMKDREPIQVGLPGLGCATFSEVIRQGRLIGERVGVYESNNPLSSFEVRTKNDLELFNKLKDTYFS